jgi:two-component system nitrate/nitrite response regulator NarL
MVKIVVLDDHSFARIGLVSLLQRNPRFEIVGEFRSFTPVMSAIATMNAHLFVVDISLNKECGFDVARYIKNANASFKVIIFTAYKDEFYIVNAVESGIDGYIHKDAEPEEMLLGINKVLDGERFYSLEISNLLVSNLYKRSYRGLPFLTHKEKEIIRFLMEGFSSKEIAARLEVSPRTIDTHRANILGKFNLRNTTELIAKIAEQKIAL